MGKHSFFYAILLSTIIGTTNLYAETAPQDSTRIVDIEEVVIISTPKETGKLRQQPSALTLLSNQDLQRHGVNSLKGLSDVVPNLHMPDYGSRLTSAIYIRGIGSRINTPAVGLYVDNVPYFDKSAFDFNFYDIERIDVLRGPQGTLYGRNSMGGLIRINTRSPFSYQGTDIKLGMATGDTHRRASITHYHRVSNTLAVSGGGYYDGSSGFYKNSYRHQRQDKMESGGGRIRAIYRPSEKLRFDFSTGYDYTHEGGYPYFYLGQQNGEETHPELIGLISANEKSSYTRGMLNSGLNIEYQGKGFTMNAVTGFQHLQDRMFMDQDFISDNTYTLEQRQKLSILSEEITVKSSNHRTWEWVNGISTSKQWLRTIAPVVFKTGGIEMLQNNINGYMPDLSDKGISSMAVTINDPSLRMGGHFQTPATNFAAFHQSTLNITPKLSATIGARLDYEHNTLSYNAPSAINYDFSMKSSRMPINLNGLEAAPDFNGKISRDYLEVLPKTAVTYKPGKDIIIYASAAKGHRPGGYNVQMFSEILQGAMRNAMMRGIKGETSAQLDKYAQMGMPEMVINMIKNGLEQMPVGDVPDVSKTVTYKPEYSWNYELGMRSKICETLSLDLAMFFSTIRDQQISRFATSGLGRMMVNAGRSRSYGAELSLKYAPTEHLRTWVSYGFTHATFTKYDEGNGNDYTGNKVPFIPRHTISIGGDYSLSKRLTVGADMLANGRTYWNESNSASQSMYTIFGAHAMYDLGNVTVNLWGKNLTNRHYQSFYFESLHRGYAQKGRPIQLGVDVNIKF